MSIDKHNADYRQAAHEEYSMEELGQWVALLAKRATHRANAEKRTKDLYDAQNYLDMMQARLTKLGE